MVSNDRLNEFIPSLATTPLRTSLYRAIHLRWLLEKREDFDIFYVGGASAFGGRYTPINGPRSLYLACERSTADDEVNQEFFDLQTGSPTIPATTLFTVTVSLSRMLDLTSPDVQNTLETNDDELIAPWRNFLMQGMDAPTQILGRAAFDSNMVAGLIYPSAASRRLMRSETGRCCILFLDRLVGQSGDFVQVTDPAKYQQRIP